MTVRRRKEPLVFCEPTQVVHDVVETVCRVQVHCEARRDLRLLLLDLGVMTAREGRAEIKRLKRAKARQ